MTLRSHLAANQDSYRRLAEDWNEARQGLDETEHKFLRAFLDGLPARSKVLDLGCGSGRPIGVLLARAGHLLTGVDQSAEMLANARRHLPKAVWIESSLEEFRSQERFAGIVCWDALFHVGRRRQFEFLSRAADYLEPGGRLMLSVGGSGPADYSEPLLGEELHFESHPPHAVLSRLKHAGLVPLVAEFTDRPSAMNPGRFAIVAARV